MSTFQLSPKNLLLGILQSGNEESIPIKSIIHIGELFGFSSNTMRVNVTRLLGAQVLEQDERGCYRLTQQALSTKNQLLAHLVERWHLGEKRRINWDKSWLMALLPDKRATTSDKNNISALNYLGFRPATPNQWVRPNNLTYSRHTCEDSLLKLGLTNEAQIFTVSELNEQTETHWLEDLWQTDDMQEDYQSLLNEIVKSKQQINKISLDEAVVETFILGSSVVNTLAIDPLLPEEMMASTHRSALHTAMEEYEIIGKTVWADKMKDMDSEVLINPKHLNFLQTINR